MKVGEKIGMIKFHSGLPPVLSLIILTNCKYVKVIEKLFFLNVVTNNSKTY